MDFISERKYSCIESENPDPDKFPLYYKARKTVVELHAGEMLFIPAGMFHFVISEKGDDTDGLNFAINFWYVNKKNTSDHIVSRHDIPDIVSHMDMNKRLEVYKSKTKLFPPSHLLHRYPGLIDIEIMSFDEFLHAKNSHYYIIQHSNIDFDNFVQYSPDKTNRVKTISTWCNFGNGVTSLLHYDEADNWLCQIRGKKRILLFPNEDRDLLYMWNPMNINTINQLSSNYFLNFFVVAKNKISEELITTILNENRRYFKNELMTTLLKNEVIKYELKINTLFCQTPTCTLPWKFEIVKTNNIDYPKISERKVTFPYVILWIIYGKGYIHINGNYKFNLEPKQLVIFPASFMFTWSVSGDLIFVTVS